MYVCMYVCIYIQMHNISMSISTICIYLSIYIYILGIFHTEFASQGTGQGRSWSSFHRVPRREFHHLSLHRFENGNVTCKPRMMMLLFENWVFWCVLFEISDHCLKYFTDTPIYIYICISVAGSCTRRVCVLDVHLWGINSTKLWHDCIFGYICWDEMYTNALLGCSCKTN